MKTKELVAYLDDRLQVEAIEDASRNGLQVQGRAEVHRVGLATDAALVVYRQAAEAACDMLIVHHGLIWGGIQAVTDRNYMHIKFLIDNELNLYAAHLPLDIHEELGNNAALAAMVDLRDRQPFGTYHGTLVGISGCLPDPVRREELAACWQMHIGGKPLILPFGKERIQTMGIVSGSGSCAMQEAIDRGLDCFVTGEGAHQDHHIAMEAGLNVIYLGHYQSEIHGVKSVGAELEARFGLETLFIDAPTLL